MAGILISIGFLLWSLRGVDLGEVWRFARGAKPGPLLLAIAIATAVFPLRALRWRVLLRTEDDQPLPMGPTWHAVAMGFMANNLFPLRAGELLRSFSLSRLANVRFSASLASVAVERVFDGLTVVSLLLFGLFGANLPADVTIGGRLVTDVARQAGLVSLAALTAAILVVSFPLLAERAVRTWVPIRGLSDRLVGLIEGIRFGFSALRSPGRVVAVAAWSFVIWVVNALSFWVAFQAFDIPVGVPGAFLLMGILVFGIALPSSPGFVGVFEAAVVVALGLFGVGKDQAFAYSAVYHITTFLPITLMGLWSMARTQIGLGDVRRADA